MTGSAVATHVCFGNPSDHLDAIEAAAEVASSIYWTINGEAVAGDLVAFYLVRPLSSFIAMGRVASSPQWNGDPDWEGHFMADIDDITMLRSPVHIRDIRQQFPNWAWLRQPRRSRAVPAQFSNTFLQLLRSADPFASNSDIEGIRTEVNQLVSKRSRRLRDKALQLARGVCCVCESDFSRLLGGRGIRVLQVHHRNQLSISDTPRLTRVDELAVVCANCHLLLHLDSKTCLEIDELRSMLRSGNKLNTSDSEGLSA